MNAIADVCTGGKWTEPCYGRAVAAMFFRWIGLGLAVNLLGSATSVVSAGSVAPLDPIAFFTGRTQGKGELDTLFRRPTSISVDSVGRREGDMLTLDQTIREGEKPARVRCWTMRRVAADRYTGTLTDAEGPVQVTVTGRRANISYRMKGGLGVDQQLTLQSDGRTLLNRMRVKKFGLEVATLTETIRKLD
jgi:hypothetical protein